MKMVHVTCSEILSRYYKNKQAHSVFEQAHEMIDIIEHINEQAHEILDIIGVFPNRQILKVRNNEHADIINVR